MGPDARGAGGRAVGKLLGGNARNFSFVGRSRAGEQKLMEMLHYRFTSVLSASRVRMVDIILAT